MDKKINFAKILYAYPKCPYAVSGLIYSSERGRRK